MSSSSSSSDLVEKYKQNGYPTLRSSTHVVRNARKLGCKTDLKQNQRTLPISMMTEIIHPMTITSASSDSNNDNDNNYYSNLKLALIAVLQKEENQGLIGSFDKDNDTNHQLKLEYFRVPMESLTPSSSAQAKRQSIEAQANLSDLISSDKRFMQAFDRIVQDVALPFMKQRLIQCHSKDDDNDGNNKEEYEKSTLFTFYYQRPPTIRIQPGPSNRSVRTHKDADYGHQDGELNFWMPFTDINLTQTTLWAESQSHKGDFHSLDAKPGEVIVFHGTSCRHYVPPNPTKFTRVSMDFRVGVKGYFDPHWAMKGTSNDHTRREVTL